MRAAGSEGDGDASPSQARRRARQAPRGSAPHSGPGHLRRRRQDRRHAASGVQAQRRGARPHPLDRHQRRRGDGRRRGGVHGRRDRRVSRADADRHAVSLAAASCGRRGCRALRRRAGRGRRRQRSLRRTRRRRRDRRRLRHAACGRRSGSGDDRHADGHSPGLRQQPRGGARAERHGRHARLQGGRFGGRQGVCRGRGRDLAAHGQPPARAQRDGAARRGRPLRAGQGGDDDLVVDAEPAHPQDDDRGDERPRTASGPRHRSRSRRRLRRQDQHLRRGVCRRGRSRSSSACR